MKNRIVYASLGCILLLVCMSLLFTLPPSSAQNSTSNDQFDNECRELLDGIYLKANNRKVLIEDYLPPFQNPNVERLLYELRLDILKSLISQKPPVCYDLDALEKILMGGEKLSPTPVPTPGPNVRTSPTPTSTPTPTPLPTKTPLGANLILNPTTPPIKDTPEEREKRWKRIKKLLDKLFPATGEVEERVRKIKEKNKLPKPPDDVKADEQVSGGLRTIKFDVPEGKIEVKLPDDMRAGDTITGTVVSEPNGKTEEERKTNGAELKKYGIEITTFPPTGGTSFPKGTTTVPPSLETYWRAQSLNTLMNFIITNELSLTPATDLAIWNTCDISLTKNDPQTNIPIELVQLSLVSTRPITVTPPTARDNQWQLPKIIQAGRPIEIRGSFDGNAGNTSVAFGDKTLPVLVESPRACIVGPLAYAQGNEIHMGPGEIRVSEDGKQKTLPMRTVGVNLTSPKTNLRRGEKTTVSIEVSGLNGLLETEIVPLQLVSSGVINMAGGDSQSLQIRGRDVDQNGVFRATREVTGHSTGGWGVTATVIDPRWRPIYIPLILNSKGNGFRPEPDKGKLGSFFDIFDVRDPRDGKPLNGEHKLEYKCEGKTPTLSKIPYISRLFMNNGKSTVKSECLIMITPKIIIQDE